MSSPDNVDAEMMRRCLALSRASGEQGEYPYAAVISRNGQFVCESINRVTRDRDAMRHAEVVALGEAEKALGRTSLDDCTIYVNAEPCAFCCYAIRETRIGRVVYGLKSPVMGGHSRWDVLGDTGLSDAMPEVFAPPPGIVAGYMDGEAEAIIKAWNPLAWRFIHGRGLFVENSGQDKRDDARQRQTTLRERLMRTLRWLVFDRFGRK